MSLVSLSESKLCSLSAQQLLNYTTATPSISTCSLYGSTSRAEGWLLFISQHYTTSHALLSLIGFIFCIFKIFQTIIENKRLTGNFTWKEYSFFQKIHLWFLLLFAITCSSKYLNAIILVTCFFKHFLLDFVTMC